MKILFYVIKNDVSDKNDGSDAKMIEFMDSFVALRIFLEDSERLWVDDFYKVKAKGEHLQFCLNLRNFREK